MNFEKLILSLEDRPMQKIIRELDRNELIDAVRGESLEVLEKIFRNVSIRLANTVKEEVRRTFAMRSSIQKAQEKVIEIARHLADTREITIDPAILQEPDDPQEMAPAEGKSFRVLSPAKEPSTEEKTSRLIQQIETAINGDGKLWINFYQDDKEDVIVKRAFDFFSERHDDLRNIKDLTIPAKCLKSAELLFSLGALERLSVSMRFDAEAVLLELIVQCAGLKELVLPNINALPEWLENLKFLESLDISSSGIEYLPDTIGSLRSLQSLNLSHTDIKKLPYDLTKLKSLRELKLIGLPIKKEDIPPEMTSNKNLHIFLSHQLIPDDDPLFYEDYVAIYQQIVATAYCWSEKARREGFLALEETLEMMRPDEFSNVGIRLVVDGTDAEIISHILSNLIECEKDPYRKTLKKMMKEAILSIQAGDNPMDSILMINSMANIKDDPITKLIADYFTTGDTSAMDRAFHELAEKEFPFRDSVEDPEIIDFVKRAMMMCNAVCQNGLQSLENLVIREKGSRDIFEYGISLVIDKYDESFIKKLLDNLVSHETEPAMKTLAAIKREAVLSISSDNPHITLIKLTSLAWPAYTDKYSFGQELIQD